MMRQLRSLRDWQRNRFRNVPPGVAFAVFLLHSATSHGDLAFDVPPDGCCRRWTFSWLMSVRSEWLKLGGGCDFTIVFIWQGQSILRMYTKRHIGTLRQTSLSRVTYVPFFALTRSFALCQMPRFKIHLPILLPNKLLYRIKTFLTDDVLHLAGIFQCNFFANTNTD